MDQFIAWENIKHFRDRLLSENDPATRARLQRLLVAEEDKLAADLELLADIERHIAHGNRLIERQRALVATLERDGRDGIQSARNLLDGMMEAQVLHAHYRARVRIAIEQNRL